MLARVAAVIIACTIASPVEAKILRSAKAIAEFKRLHPCPETGASVGPCPGYQIDHRIPLKCKGADDPNNMQWLSIEAHAAKTRAESHRCLHQNRRPWR